MPPLVDGHQHGGHVVITKEVLCESCLWHSAGITG
jgi:hypothetical protein